MCIRDRRKLTKAAKRRGLDCGRDQVERLMKRQGIRGASRAKKRFTTHADKNNLRAPDLVNRAFVATRPDQLWVADFTYCSTSRDVYKRQHYHSRMSNFQDFAVGLERPELLANDAMGCLLYTSRCV